MFLVLTPVSSVIQRVPGGVPLVPGGARPGDDLPTPRPLDLGVVEHGVLPSLRGLSATERQLNTIVSWGDICITTYYLILSSLNRENHHKTKIKTKMNMEVI